MASADRAAIEQSSRDFSQAFAKGDSKAIAAMWTEDGEFHDDSGVSLRGRAEIEKAFSEHFKQQSAGQRGGHHRAPHPGQGLGR